MLLPTIVDEFFTSMAAAPGNSLAGQNITDIETKTTKMDNLHPSNWELLGQANMFRLARLFDSLLAVCLLRTNLSLLISSRYFDKRLSLSFGRLTMFAKSPEAADRLRLRSVGLIYSGW